MGAITSGPLFINLRKVLFRRQLRLWSLRRNTVDSVTISLSDPEGGDPVAIILHLLGIAHTRWALYVRKKRKFPKVFHAVAVYYPRREFIRELKSEGFVLLADYSVMIAESDTQIVWHSLLEGVSIWIAPCPSA